MLSALTFQAGLQTAPVKTEGRMDAALEPTETYLRCVFPGAVCKPVYLRDNYRGHRKKFLQTINYPVV